MVHFVLKTARHETKMNSSGKLKTLAATHDRFSVHLNIGFNVQHISHGCECVRHLNIHFIGANAVSRFRVRIGSLVDE